MHPTDDPKDMEFGDHGRRTYENLTKNRSLSEEQLEIARELARIADARSAINHLTNQYSLEFYRRKKDFPKTVYVRDLYEVERRSENSVPEHRTVAVMCKLLGVTDDTPIDLVSKITRVKTAELTVRLENIV